MKLIVSRNNDTWTGILMNKEKLYYSSYFYKTREEAISRLTKLADSDVEIMETTNELIEAINNIANGISFSLPKISFDFSGYSEKEIAVLKALLKVPAGQTVSYGELATQAGLPHAARFVGNVMAKNRFGPLIPCHRVIKSDGKLGNFSGFEGPKLKRKLLEQEGVIF